MSNQENNNNEYPVVSMEIMDKCYELWTKINEVQGILFLTSETFNNCFASSASNPSYEQSCAMSSSLSHSVKMLAEIGNSLDVGIELPLSRINRDRN
jgi:hypothetical protein